MAFSTVDEARYNLGKTIEDVSETLDYLGVTLAQMIENRIAYADNCLKTDLSPYIPPAVLYAWVVLDPDVPQYSRVIVNKMSQCKTCEMVLRHIYPNRRIDDDRNKDIEDWKNCYDSTLKKIEDGEIVLYDVNNDSANTVTPTISDRETTTFGNAPYGGKLQ